MTNRPHSNRENDPDQSATVASSTYERGENESVSEAVVRAVAAHRELSPLELEPLYDVIDPEHLDDFFEDTSESTSVSPSMTFGLDGCEVTVTTEEIAVRDIEGDAAD